MFPIFIAFLVVINFVQITNGIVQVVEEEQKIHIYLFTNCNINIRPNDLLDVNLTFIKVKSTRPTKTSIDFTLEWIDQRLSWNESDFSGIKQLKLKSSLIWVPDLWTANDGLSFNSTRHISSQSIQLAK